MSIAFISTDFFRNPQGIVPGGCAFYRCYLPMNVSRRNSRLGYPAWDGVKGFGILDSEDSAVFGFSTVVMKLVMFRWTPRQVEMAKILGQRIIVDIDDHYEAISEENAAFHITHPEKNKVSNRDHYARVIERADVVTVSTPELLEFYGKLHPDVRMVRNGVLPEMFHVKRQERRPVIGWAGATSYRSGDLDVLKGWLPRFLADNDLMFHHSGHVEGIPSFGDIVGIPPERITYSPLVGMHQYPLSLLNFDIGIVPLTDVPFNRAKSNIKGLEYASAGVPFVASALPEYNELCSETVGRIAGSPEEWMKHLSELIPVKARKKEAFQQRKAVAERHSIYARAGEWQEIFNSCG